MNRLLKTVLASGTVITVSVVGAGVGGDAMYEICVDNDCSYYTEQEIKELTWSDLEGVTWSDFESLENQEDVLSQIKNNVKKHSP